MEYKVLEKITEQVRLNKKVALAVITRVEGSSPREQGAMMAVLEDGKTYGTIGGGKLELVVTEYAKKCIANGKNETYRLKLNDEEGSLHMKCGGQADVFIKVFKPNYKLLIVGGGHIAFKLYEIGKILGLYTVIFEDREEYCRKDRFPEADELKLGSIEESLKNYPIDENCYIVIVTRGHKFDEIALKTVIYSKAKYIGMIGSVNKTKYVFDNLRRQGVSDDILGKVFAPIGLKLGGHTPEEIALSIMSEILLIKNNGVLKHMKELMMKDDKEL
ncbi:xanthine dehydrogenase [Caloranaerobacter sp. TR13]|uniref:XdhC family protein n=1 Tax=Caloranaerobacter sp. TR13 TaxID=1302151 RepID=UPI0006D490ED|nr:XdhC/CoxI family protein [Caloranaerobacter sp. TR13]KPU27595.1 xanthine dehydrogenase [Caloranaerobacter sp. TR13]